MADQREVFKELIKQALRAGKRPTGKMPEWLYPWAVERRYAEELQKFMAGLFGKYIDRVLSELDRWVIEARRDSWDEEFDRETKRAEAEIDKAMAEDVRNSDVYPVLEAPARGINEFNGAQWAKATEKVLGNPYRSAENWWPQVKQEWEKENYRLIKSLNAEGIKVVNETVYRGIRTGAATETIRKELQSKVKDITKNRARLIARDQVGKLNGRLTEKRQTEVGLSMYTWRTAKDERVRGRPGGKYPNAVPSHWVMEGLLCRWDDSSLYADPSASGEGPAAPSAPLSGTPPEEAYEDPFELPQDMDDSDRAHEEFEEEFEEEFKLKDWSEDQKLAVSAYKRAGYEDMNHVLRHGTLMDGRADGPRFDRITEDNEFLSAAAKHQSLKKPVRVYRGMGQPSPIDIQPGDTIIDKGFASTAAYQPKTNIFRANAMAKGDNAAEWDITLPKGMNYIPGEQSEYEMILPPGTRLKVLSVDTVEDEVLKKNPNWPGSTSYKKIRAEVVYE